MQGIEATFDDLSFEDGDTPQRVVSRFVPGAAALALAGAVSVWALHALGPAIPEGLFTQWTSISTERSAVSRPFADIPIDANVLAQLKSTAPASTRQQVASLEIPLPSLE